jgi:hypothetical protein
LAVPKPWNDPKFFYALPTRDQAKRVAWGKLKALVPDDWQPTFYEGDLVIRTAFDSELYVVGMDKPQRIEGVGFDGGIIDESCDQKPEAFSLSIRPALSDRSGYCRRIGVPKRAGVGASDFRDFCQSKDNPDVAVFHWRSEDVLPAAEIESAKRSLSPIDYEEQYGATWQNASGTIFYMFREELEPAGNLSLRAVYDPSQPIVIGMDFNVDPMAWTLNHVIDGKLFTFDELWLRNTNTRQALDVLASSSYGKHQPGWIFIGDASSRARKTSAAATDYIQIANDPRFHPKQLLFPAVNPPLEDRFAAANAKLCNGLMRRDWLINPNCKYIIKDLNNRAYKPGTREPNDGPLMGHISDAGTYIVHRLWPLTLEVEGEIGIHATG